MDKLLSKRGYLTGFLKALDTRYLISNAGQDYERCFLFNMPVFSFRILLVDFSNVHVVNDIVERRIGEIFFT